MPTKCSGQNFLPAPLSGNFDVFTLPPWRVFSTASIYRSKKPRWRSYTPIWWQLLLSYQLLSLHLAPSSVPHLSPQRRWRTVQSTWGLDLWKGMGKMEILFLSRAETLIFSPDLSFFFHFVLSNFFHVNHFFQMKISFTTWNFFHILDSMILHQLPYWFFYMSKSDWRCLQRR